MSRRDELAEKIIAGFAANPAMYEWSDAETVRYAFALADAFLARCEPEVTSVERKPDAYITIANCPGGPFFEKGYNLWGKNGVLAKLLAGRTRARLEVRVVEVDE